MTQKFEDLLAVRSEWFTNRMKSFLNARPDNVPPRLWEAMCYSLEAGGKRIRPVLCQEGARLAGVKAEDTFPMALALEMVHTASLIHDDLPCMDNDSLRRGKPTNHSVFGESLALLAGDALLCFGFQTALEGLKARKIETKRVVRAMELFASALGPQGMCGGQTLDTDLQSRASCDLPFVQSMASGKTMALIRCSVLCGLCLGERGDALTERLDEYGRRLGLAFQIADDLLDATATTEEAGKTTGKDEEQDKATFVCVLGVDGAKARLKEETDAAVAAVKDLPSPDFLIGLAKYLESRSK